MPLDQQGFILPEAKPTTRELPDRLSELLLVALEDLEKIEANNLYRVNMNIWHDPIPKANGEDGCLVCFAGGVMAYSLGASPEATMRPGIYTNAVRDKLYALNVLRVGMVGDALRQVGQTRPYSLQAAYDIVSYERAPARFKADMHKLANRLAEAGC